jgi:hypothetical protein
VNAHCSSAFRACPPGFLGLQKSGDAGTPDSRQILDHAHLVLSPVSFIQMIKSVAGHFFAIRTKRCLSLFENPAILDFARNAGLGLFYIVNSTAWTFVRGSQIGHANSAVHSARCYQESLA